MGAGATQQRAGVGRKKDPNVLANPNRDMNPHIHLRWLALFKHLIT